MNSLVSTLFNVWDTHFEKNRINWLHLRFSLNIYMSVGGTFSLIYYVTLCQNSLCKLIWSFVSCLATSKHCRQDFRSCPPLPTHLSMIIMLCCMLLLSCSSFLFIYSRRLEVGVVKFAISLQLVGAHDACWSLISTWLSNLPVPDFVLFVTL